MVSALLQEEEMWTQQIDLIVHPKDPPRFLYGGGHVYSILIV